MTKHIVNIEKSKCIGCGLCSKTCVANNIEIKNGKAETRIDNCLMCGQCSAICPKEAITIRGYQDQQVVQNKNVQLNPNDVLDVIRFRRTMRKFQNKPIPEHVIEQILEAGRITHTAKNMQDISFVVLDKEKDRIEQMAIRLFKRIKPFADFFSPMARNNKIHDHFFFFKAPIVIVILAKEKTNGILAAQNMEFVAEANGLGVLFSGYFTSSINASRKIKKALNVPKGYKAAMTLVLGYPGFKYQRSAPREILRVQYL